MTGSSDRNFTKITLWQGFCTRQIFRRGSWPAFWKGIEYLENSTQVPEKSISVFSFPSLEICCRCCISILLSKSSKTEIFKDLKITSIPLEAPTPPTCFGIFSKIYFYFSQDKKLILQKLIVDRDIPHHLKSRLELFYANNSAYRALNLSIIQNKKSHYAFSVPEPDWKTNTCWLFLYFSMKEINLYLLFPPFRLIHGKANSSFIYPLSTCSGKNVFALFLRKKINAG